jgi:hypothetical protein
VLVVSSLTVAVGATLDVSNNAVDIGSGVLSTITSLVASGYADGTWAGTGIDSSSAASNTAHLTALGVMQNNQGGSPLYSASNLFEGTGPGASDILIKYTYYGDTNLDGKVDGSDYSRIDNGAMSHLTGWYNGDFNYDGVANGSDYALIDNAYNTQGAQFSGEIADATAVVATPGGGTTAVPEPGSLCVLVLAGLR